MNLKTQIEALLFLTDKPLKTQVIARTLNQDVQQVRQAMIELINDYESRNGAIEIADEDGYMMQVKDEFSNLVDEFAPFEMPTALVRTLSAIAIKQPVMQSEIVKLRGAGAYDHIKELIIRDLVHRKEDGRSPILTTTKKFQEYFRLSKDGQNFRHQMEKATKAEKRLAKELAEAEQIQLEFDATPPDASAGPDMSGEGSLSDLSMKVGEPETTDEASDNISILTEAANSLVSDNLVTE